MSTPKNGRTRELPGAVMLAFSCALLTALLRAVMLAGARDLFEGPLDLRLAQSLTRETLEGLGLVTVFYAGLLLAALALRRGRYGHLLSAPVGAFYAFFTWGVVSLRWPVESPMHPSFDTTTALVANLGSMLAGLLLASLVLLSVLAPRPVRLLATGMRWLSALLLLALLVLWGQARSGREPSSRPNVLLISIDTLRADHLACYGAARNPAPNIERFAEESLRFEKAFTNHPWTLTSHATMLTGMLPSAHGITRTTGLDPSVPTVAAQLKDEGYRTFGVVDWNEWLNPRYGYSRGFERYQRLDGEAPLKVAELLDCIDDARFEGAGPFFGFAHFYDVHSDWDELPYDSEPQDRQRFAGWYDGDFTGCDDELGCASTLLVAMNGMGETLQGDDLRYLRDLYDAGVATLDRNIGVLFDELERRGVFEDTVVILTSDHGEEFFDHGKALHGQHFDECLHVPLMIRAPGGLRGQALDELVGTVDIAPTILEFAGVDTSAQDQLQGRSLAPLAFGKTQGVPEWHPILFDTGNGIFGLRTPRYAVVRSPGEWLLFDTLDDPGELENIYASNSLGEQRMDDLRRVLLKRRDATLALGERFGAHTQLEDVEDQAAARLAALGYVDEDEQPEAGSGDDL